MIQVERGQFQERPLIDKPLTLVGVNRPTLNAQGEGDVIRVRAADVRIEGFIVRDSGSDLTEQNAGIYVEPGADRLVVRNNHLVYNLFGVWLNGVKDVQILGNRITGKRDLASAQRGNGIHEDAQQFARQYGGKVLRFAEITPDMVSLDGGVLRDQRM